VASLSGIDVSCDSIAQARADNAGVDYRDFDGMNFPFDDASFDLVTAICVVHHIQPAEWMRFAREMCRVTRPGGLVCVIEHNPFNPLTRLAVARCKFDTDAVLLGAGNARKLMSQAGASNVGKRHFLLLPSELKSARRIERALGGLALGAQYAVFGTRSASASKTE
jgi:SAM-dependent methyltransferase